MASPKSNEPRLVVQNIISTALQLLQYGRLMLILFALGVVIALAYYVYGRPIYFSRSMVRLTVLELPVASDGGREERNSSLRSITQRLESGTLVLRVVQKLGKIRKGAAPEDVAMEVIPTLRIDLIDSETLQVNVFSYYPEVVRDFAKVLVDEFESMEREARDEFRDKALPAYIAEAEAIKGKANEKTKLRMKYEREHDMANLYIKQHNLEKVPRDIVLAQEQLRQMQGIRSSLDELKNSPNVVAKLSLLSAYKIDEPTEVGSVSRSTTGSLNPVVNEGAKVKVGVVVQPGAVIPLNPWQQLEQRRRQLDEEIKLAKPVYQPGHEVMVKLNKEVAEVEEKLKSELVTMQSKFDFDYEHLLDNIKMFQEKIPEYNKVTEEYELARQDYEMNESGQIAWDKAHAALAASINKLQYGDNKQRIHLRFMGVEMIRDIDPISPNKSKLAMIGLALGLGLACGAPLVIKFLDTSASRVEEIESVTGLTGIGVVPNTDKRELDAIFRSEAIDSAVPNHLLEAFRIIRSQILIRPNNQKKNQVIMVTSARPSEGKSTQAANLAWAFYSMGERTLLVDCDLRRGRIAKITLVNNSPGLTNLLVDKCTEAQAICKTSNDLLDVIPRGPVIAGTTEVLCQEKFHEMVAKWRTEYDRIIIDSPPVLGLSETASLQDIADGVVLVIRSEVTRLVDVSATVDQLRRSGAHFFGFVLNAVDLTKLTNYYYYYYYSPDYYGDFMPGENDATPA